MGFVMLQCFDGLLRFKNNGKLFDEKILLLVKEGVDVMDKRMFKDKDEFLRKANVMIMSGVCKCY